jgi:hypothetical protein
LPYRSEVVLHIGEGDEVLAAPDSTQMDDSMVEETPVDDLFGEGSIF